MFNKIGVEINTISTFCSTTDFQIPQLNTKLQPTKKQKQHANVFLFFLIGGVLVIGKRDSDKNPALQVIR